MCTTGQLLIYDSPEGKAELPTCDLCLVAFLCLLSRVETTFAYRIPRAASRYLDLLVSLHRAMSFKCRAKALEGMRFQSIFPTESLDGKIIETSYTNSGRQGVHTDV